MAYVIEQDGTDIFNRDLGHGRPPQDTYSDARQLLVDERLSFSPWHALEAHRPLGGIMRSRLKAYEEAIRYRAQRNERERAEPSDISQVPA